MHEVNNYNQALGLIRRTEPYDVGMSPHFRRSPDTGHYSAVSGPRRDSPTSTVGAFFRLRRTLGSDCMSHI
jgi:hypothetical protein